MQFTVKMDFCRTMASRRIFIAGRRCACAGLRFRDILSQFVGPVRRSRHRAKTGAWRRMPIAGRRCSLRRPTFP
ncbi:hypothetical protein LNQ03_28170 [Klebsiella pneumoniae subsp. pneumoniae]|nr:hypothetical protein [Klebsiella pneumoniae subsp. pneumoniae]